MLKEARYYEKHDGGSVTCKLCPQECFIKNGKIGICQNKLNKSGTLYAAHYAEAAAVNVDPIEKKPLYHFHPGSQILSFGTIGCNFNCRFCQNYHLVEGSVPTEDVTIEELIAVAKRTKSVGISYTYNEPLINFEFVLDCSKAFKKAGLQNVLVTNGYINPEPLDELLEYTDALNIDLKFMDEEKYKKWSGAKRGSAVKENIATAAKRALVEVTNLIIPDLNDSEGEIKALIDFVANISRDIPLHFSRYHPDYKLNNPATPEKTLENAYKWAKEKLNYVYIGNVWGGSGQHSTCPACDNLLVERQGFSTRVVGLKGSSCAKCSEKLAFVN